MLNATVEMIGRQLRVGLVGGGEGSPIECAAGAIGGQVFGIEVYGEKGGLQWEQGQPNVLFRHPEGFRGAFSSIESDFADVLAAEIAGVAPPAVSLEYPGIKDGADGLAWGKTCARSRKKSGWAALMRNANAEAGP